MTIRIDGTNTTANPGITGADADTGLQFGTDEVKIVTGGTDAVTVDSSQRVGIGTASPGAALDVRSRDLHLGATSGGAGLITFRRDSGDQSGFFGWDSGSNLIMRWANNSGSGQLAFDTNSTERMRLDENGRLLLGTSSVISSSKLGVLFNGSTENGIVLKTTRTSTGSYYAVFVNSAGTTTGGIIHNTTSTVNYSTSSDYRLKENVVPLTGAADRVNQLQVHRFNFIADPDTTVDGFLAHEAQAVVPECVTGEKDEVDDEGNPVYQGIDQSKLVPLLTAALQEALAKIETLEARLTTLEGGINP